ncbi:DNA-binding transcriptional regulator [Commensalibacter communis]|uniref:MarR family (MarR) n=1 Tax=Commensalibacter communis TaxID=2972786 RepID=A0A9W4X696_9PROT|nr:MarR family winged helix-turn-helix transcriptional regulator [Commensalibacter communis]CAI3922626.1 DNA-binding transcriptional regulator [Commensalibacter communis]CAI3930028.1 DNA-binding transcriptional regulator [Commensalibacter communis]CAI3930616.1 DNA-binding transcriptional regulator [Commensalibacter communis]CAI3930877.1 DNA-binding transcriptional regulator [Commensalibacter communis]CAI3932416.1 DNA-binding transcriptional regulator [Commensalibacter communis]
MYRPFPHDLPISKPGEELLFLREEKIRFMQDVLFFIDCELHNATKPILQEYGIGHAHHRLMQFVCHCSGASVSEICKLLGITKQSLNRVLRDVLELGYIEYRTNAEDRRKKSLYLTPQGEKIEEKLFQLQRKQFLRAFREAPNNTYIEGFQRILYGMLSIESKQLLELHSSQKPDKGKA